MKVYAIGIRYKSGDTSWYHEDNNGFQAEGHTESGWGSEPTLFSGVMVAVLLPYVFGLAMSQGSISKGTGKLIVEAR